jgi:hypothetical protein
MRTACALSATGLRPTDAGDTDLNRLGRLPVNAAYLYKLMRNLFRRANDWASFHGSELVGELNRFGIQSRKQARLLLKRHRRAVIRIDRKPLDALHERLYLREQPDELRRFRRTGAWFAHTGLVRLALELEFGEPYDKFAQERDRVD